MCNLKLEYFPLFSFSCFLTRAKRTLTRQKTTLTRDPSRHCFFYLLICAALMARALQNWLPNTFPNPRVFYYCCFVLSTQISSSRLPPLPSVVIRLLRFAFIYFSPIRYAKKLKGGKDEGEERELCRKEHVSFRNHLWQFNILRILISNLRNRIP